VQDYPVAKHESQTAWLAKFPGHTPIWSDHLFAPDAVGPFLDLARDTVQAAGLWPWLTTMYVLVCRRPEKAVYAPFAPSCGVGGTWSVGVGLYFMVPPAGGEDGRSRVRACLHDVQTLALAAGGRPYLYSWNDLDPNERRALWGAGEDHLGALIAAHDPYGLGARG
jgi:FAD/FMN-containing dehydrogenase